ncbi:type II toxin-antitoxin system RelE/ParE family toxin [Hymenobacter caeli]|uniref:Plasmid stabilization system protein ParE n=1 Tax=Hymenobacter caeli TaxID=2735894 RepID=A0ABX2FRG8_9BACT|nr:type II toxin-antitoxin system RelE/ParE family toxin [Hymenobacter caeli]NRT19782.1 plasmid stabilization system protein ParE [Hymenobacter caeli]
MVQIRWTNAALADLAEVRDYALQFSARYAEQLIERLIERTDTLAEFPRLGRVVPEYGNAAVRELLDGRYRLMYEIINTERVDIIHIHPTAKPFLPNQE